MHLFVNINDSFEDFDNDTMHNLWEYNMRLNASFNDAYYDNDGDWISNLLEYQEDTDAADFWSVPLFYHEFPFLCFSCVHFLFLLVIAFSSFLGFGGAYLYQNRKKNILKHQLGAPDFETARLMVKGGFTDFRTFKKAQDLNIFTKEEYVFTLELVSKEDENEDLENLD
jgi:hypothetical protein